MLQSRRPLTRFTSSLQFHTLRLPRSNQLAKWARSGIVCRPVKKKENPSSKNSTLLDEFSTVSVKQMENLDQSNILSSRAFPEFENWNRDQVLMRW